jgi:hypothetical protein
MTTANLNGAFPRDARSAAERYLAKGLAPIPLAHRSKKPGYDGWQALRVTADTLDKHFPAGEPRFGSVPKPRQPVTDVPGGLGTDTLCARANDRNGLPEGGAP